jgi:hypothetical protein
MDANTMGYGQDRACCEVSVPRFLQAGVIGQSSSRMTTVFLFCRSALRTTLTNAPKLR